MNIYLLALGSNQRHSVYGAPDKVIEAAIAHLGVSIRALSKTMQSLPIGPSLRRYANATIVVETSLFPDEMLAQVKRIEAQFGRTSVGQRWRSRVLDIDLILWSGGMWIEPELTIPHKEFRKRGFVLKPACEIAPQWRDPVSHHTLQQLHFQFKRNRNRFLL